MHEFTTPLATGLNPKTNLPVFGFRTARGFVPDAGVSICGNFGVDPLEHYDVLEADAEALQELNRMVEEATDAAINSLCRNVQSHLGIKRGDFAGEHFANYLQVRGIAQAVVDYTLAEYSRAHGQK